MYSDSAGAKTTASTRHVLPRLWQRLAGGLLCAAALSGAQAQEFKGPITMVVGYPAGGSADIAARILADKLPALLHQPVIVENRAGAGGLIAARYVKDARADGTVLFFTNGHTVVTAPQILKNPNFDTVKDLKPISGFTSYELVIAAHPKTNATNLAQLLKYFASTPGDRNIAVPAPGSAPEFIVTRLAQMLKQDIQPVAYKGTAPTVQDLLGGQVAAAVVPEGDVLQYHTAGKVRIVSITHASDALPGVSTFADAGLGELALVDFMGVYGPAGLPTPLAEALSSAIRKVAALPDVVEKLQSHGMKARAGTPAELATAQKTSATQIAGLIKAIDYKLQ